MQKINWKISGLHECARAKIGCIMLRCTQTLKGQWVAEVSLRELSGTFRFGSPQKSLIEAKKDAIRLGREMLLDHHISLIAEMKNFDLDLEV
jgi:hypothetical protein